MKNNYFSKKDEMRPFVVKKMNTPPPSMIENNHKENEPVFREKDKPHTLAQHRITDEHVYEVSGRKDKRLISSIKPLIISALSAIAIGVLLGFFVLRMSTTSVAEPESSQTPSSSQVSATTDEEKEETASPNEYVEIDAIESYVLQAGVYSEKENADDMARELAEHGHSQIVWEENGQFFVFTNVLSTEEDAKQRIDQMGDIEVYAKQWAVEEKSVDIIEEEAMFLEKFVTTWMQTVDEHTSNESVSLIEWEKLTDEMPSTTSSIQNLVTYLDQEIVQADEAIDIEQILLDTWELYSNVEDQ